MEITETNNISFDKRKWFNSLDYTWKRILKQSIDINSAPNDDQLDEILNLVEVDCSNSSVISGEPLNYLKKLEKLTCKKTKIKTLDKLENCRRLQHLDVSFTEVNNLDFLRNFPALKLLNISSTKVESLNGIANCEGLEYLYINNTSIDDLKPLKYCKFLYSIELNSSQVSDISILSTIGVKHMYYDNTPAIDKYFDEKFGNYSKSTEVVKSYSLEYKPKVFREDFSIKNEESKIQTINIDPIPQSTPVQKNTYADYAKDYTSYYYMFGGLAVLLLLMFINFRSFSSKEDQKTVFDQLHYGVVSSGNGLNLRDEPNSNSNIILTIPGSSQVRIISKNGASETVNGVAENWYKIEYNNKEGWAWGGYISAN